MRQGRLGGSPQGEVPTLDAASLQKLIRENELCEEEEEASLGHCVLHKLCVPVW